MTAPGEIQFLNELSRRLVQARKDKSMTQEKLAELTEIDRVAIANIETGKRRPTMTTVYRLAQGIGVKLEDLLKGY